MAPWTTKVDGDLLYAAHINALQTGKVDSDGTASPEFAGVSIAAASGVSLETPGDPFQIHTQSAVFNGTRDDVLVMSYNIVPGTANTQINPAEPTMTFQIEANYEVTPGVHWIEYNMDYADAARLIGRRPFCVYIDRATHVCNIGLAAQNYYFYNNDRSNVSFSYADPFFEIFGAINAAVYIEPRVGGNSWIHFCSDGARTSRGYVGTVKIGGAFEFLVGTAINLPVRIRQNDVDVINVIAGGLVGINKAVPTTCLAVVGLPSYANDAAAGAGGLTEGDFYTETGTDPLRVCMKA